MKKSSSASGATANGESGLDVALPMGDEGPMVFETGEEGNKQEKGR